MALGWIGAACSGNALRCGRVHCSVMGPAFLILAAVGLARAFGWLTLHWNLIGIAAVGVTLLAFLPEFFGKKYPGGDPAC